VSARVECGPVAWTYM